MQPAAQAIISIQTLKKKAHSKRWRKRLTSTNEIDVSKLIRQSDPDSQYATSGYLARLQAEGCQINMTQTGDPLHNALAERMNEIIKTLGRSLMRSVPLPGLKHWLNKPCACTMKRGRINL